MFGRAVSAAGVLLVVGLLPWLTRTDPARTILHARYADRAPTASALADIRAETGLDEGPVRLLGRWAGDLARGDLGTSWVSGQPVRPDVLSALGTSLSLMGASLAVAVLLAAALSLRTLRAGARQRGAAYERPRAGAVAAALAALPEFLLAAVFATVFAVQLGWFPALGWGSAQQLVLPALAMGIPAGALLGRLLDDALPGAFAERWVATCVASGLRPARIAGYALRRVLPPLLEQFGFVVVGLTGGAVAVETLFAVPGLGGTALSAALAQDLPVLQACVLLLLVLGLAVGAAVRAARRALLGPALDAGALPALVRPRPARPARAIGWTAAVLGTALAAVVVAGLLRDPLAVDAAARLAGPSGAHPLGTDALGRDVLARLGHGAARTALAAVGVAAVTLAAGVAVGVLTRWTEGLREVANALPPVIAGLIVAGIAGPGQLGAAAAVAVVAWAPLAAHTAGLYEEERAAAHLEGAVALGAGRWHLLRHHVLPGVLPPVVRHAVLRIPALALALASLGFLGLGAGPPAPEWGRMLSENMPYAERAPWAVLAPAAALACVGVLAVLLAALRPRARTAR
ncbi:ABC transporter permease subunit [Streptomyces sp. SB3404]|uniref:ABC transporter permease subunit n=1 Tax=Streptomyces boncukensis TaxID=2711219 RepID=A0A6G4X422_9ACTN|nr:ABC transporter permease subunit [Streptomyces boncukensis]NGO72138.1 ABC transporter permease subunit [Streptomyces boncukensis]